MWHPYTRTIGLFLIALLGSSSLFAQTTCTFTLELFDDFGDGWGTAAVILEQNGVATEFSLESGVATNSLPIAVSEDDTLVISYRPGQFESDVRFNLLNNQGDVLFQAGPTPVPGDSLFVLENVICNSCRGPEASSIRVTRLRSAFVRLAWSPAASQPATSYELVFDTLGFDPLVASIRSISDTLTQVNGLLENTTYEYFLRGICPNGDPTPWQGPFQLTTPYAADVGIVGLMEPASGCDLGAITPVLIIKNFGGETQSFIPYNYEINGQPANIPMPQEGVYTGVLGVDSIDEATFDIPFNFSVPGEYEIVAWTALEGDTFSVANDTFRTTIVHQPILGAFPYTEGFETGAGFWLVDTDSQNPSWELGQPRSGALDIAGNGQVSWVTNPNGRYNDDELSYLVSPCFNFFNLSQAPQLSFQLFVETEECCDRAWLEFSIDGESWEKLGRAGTGINWYNNADSDWWEGSGGFNGWVTAALSLDNLIGQPSVQFRFVFASDAATGGAGIGIDQFTIAVPAAEEPVLIDAQRNNPQSCGTASDSLLVTIGNIGLVAVDTFSLNYRVLLGMDTLQETTEGFRQTIAPGDQTTIQLAASYDASALGDYTLVVWLETASGIVVTANDSLRIRFSSQVEAPYREDFEAGILPANWTADPDMEVTAGHNNTSFVLSDNLWVADTTFSARTPNIAAITAVDSFFFDYRIVDGFAGRNAVTLGPEDRIFVRAYTDCQTDIANSDTLFIISADNHTASTDFIQIGLSLAEYAGGSVQLEFFGEWGAGDYFVDIDRVLFQRCTGSLGLAAVVTDASTSGTTDGRIELSVGSNTGPFEFEWENLRGNSPIQANLLTGNYPVTVTDAFGCTESLNILVDAIVSTEEVLPFISSLQLAPNPTNDWADLQLSLEQTVPIEVAVFDAQGRQHSLHRYGASDQLTHRIQLSGSPAGLYFVQIRSAQRLHTIRLIKTR